MLGIFSRLANQCGRVDLEAAFREAAFSEVGLTCECIKLRETIRQMNSDCAMKGACFLGGCLRRLRERPTHLPEASQTPTVLTP
jgi:hypothetical protein